MKTRSLTIAGLVLAAGLAAQASAAITFSNLSIVGNPPGIATPTPTTTTGTDDVDVAFNFPAATVGDPVDPLRSGSLMIMYDALSTSPINKDIISVLGAVLGSGVITVETTVQDLNTPGQIASSTVVINASNPTPFTGEINFSRSTLRFQVMHMITFSAPSTIAFDVAQIGLIENRFVPTPGALALLGLGGVLAGRRRR